MSDVHHETIDNEAPETPSACSLQRELSDALTFRLYGADVKHSTEACQARKGFGRPIVPGTVAEIERVPNRPEHSLMEAPPENGYCQLA